MSKLGILLVLAASLVTSAAWAADTPFVGAWKLDAPKSRLTDQMKVESLGGNQPSYGGTMLALTLEGPDALEVVRKKDGHRLLTADWKLSQDGKTLSDDFTSYAPDGSASNLKYVYQRTTPTTGFAGTWESESVKVNFDLTIKIQPFEGSGLSVISPLADKPKNLHFDGKDTPNLASNAPTGSTYAARRVDERTLEITDEIGGKAVDTQQYALSSDLKTLTLTIRRTGMRTPNIYVFDRQ